jgi:hypothetical protein
MKAPTRFIALSLCLSLCAPLTQAQPAPGDSSQHSAQDALIIQQEQAPQGCRRDAPQIAGPLYKQPGWTDFVCGVDAVKSTTFSIVRRRRGCGHSPWIGQGARRAETVRMGRRAHYQE